MAIKYIRADPTYAERMPTVSLRAFRSDGWHVAIFPKRLQDPNDPDAIRRAMVQLFKKRLENEGVHTIVAIDEDARDENGQDRLVGYCSWHAPGKGDNAEDHRAATAGNKDATGDGWVDDGQGGKMGDGVKYPKLMDVEAWCRISELLASTKREIFGEQGSNVWYLGSLGVDPDYAGRGIGTQFTTWGLKKAEEDGIPAYLESTQAAKGMYARAGFEVIKEIQSDEDGGRPHTAMVWKPSKRID